MYKNKAAGGRNNIAGVEIARLRKAAVPRMSQRALAGEMQLRGLDLDKNAIQRIEAGQRFITDIELRAFAEFFRVPAQTLLAGPPEGA